VDKYLLIVARLGLLACALLTAGFAFAPARLGAHLFPWDKADHFASFFAITAAGVVAFPRVRLVWIALAASAAGGVIELVQALPAVGREGDIRDWAAENAAIAAVVGLLIAADLRRRLAKRPDAPAPPGRSSEV
jgi:hypothetical protein